MYIYQIHYVPLITLIFLQGSRPGAPMYGGQPAMFGQSQQQQPNDPFGAL